MKADTNAEGAFAADDINEEERAYDSSDEFHHTENGCCEELLILAFGSEESKEFRGVDCDALRARPLGEELGAQTEIDTVEIVGHEEHFLEDA